MTSSGAGSPPLTPSRRLRRFAVIGIVLLVGAVTSSIFSVPAAAAAGSILLSDDGVTFGTNYPGVLFDGIANTVPGDVQTGVIYLRNTGRDDGYVRLTLRNVKGDAVFLSALTVSASVPSRPGSTIGLLRANPCRVLNEGILLPAGATTLVTADLEFERSSGNLTQNTMADFDIGVNLSDTAVPLPPTECGGSDINIPGTTPHPDLPSTGTEVPVMIVSVTAFIIGVGAFLVMAARRSTRRDDGEEASN